MRWIALLFLLSLAACDNDRVYKWVVERGDRNTQEIQADYDYFGSRGWSVWTDGNLEESGHYVYFVKRMTSAEAKHELRLVRDRKHEDSPE